MRKGKAELQSNTEAAEGNSEQGSTRRRRMDPRRGCRDGNCQPCIKPAAKHRHLACTIPTTWLCGRHETCQVLLEISSSLSGDLAEFYWLCSGNSKASCRHTWALGRGGLQKFTASGVVLLPACKTQLVFLTKILRHFSASAAWKALPSSSPTTGFPPVKNWDVPKIAPCYTAVLSNFDPVIPSKRGDPGTGAGSPLTAQEPPTEPQLQQEGFKEVVWGALCMHSSTGDLMWFTSKKIWFLPCCSVKTYWCRPTTWPEIIILIWGCVKKNHIPVNFLLINEPCVIQEEIKN